MAEKHIGNRQSNYVVVSTAPDVCKVGDALVPFDSFQDLSHEKSYVTHVRARGQPILTVGSVIAGTQSNAGKGVSSGTSLGNGDCQILTGVPHIKCKGMPIARHGSLVAMNNGNTLGTLYTQINSPNGPIQLKTTPSLWEKLAEQETERQRFGMENNQQMAELLEGMGRGFINHQYDFGRDLGTGSLQNGSIELEQQIALLKLMGADTRGMEAANVLNKPAIDAIDASPSLLEMENETQEMGAKIETGLELLMLVKALLGSGINLLKEVSGRRGVDGVKVVVGSSAENVFTRDQILRNIEESKRSRISSNFKDYSEWPPNRGVKGMPFKYILLPGTKIDRYGHEYGVFVSPEGIPYRSRSLKPGTDGKTYSVYEVQKEITVEAGEIAPWFGYEGGGMQFELPDTVDNLKKIGILKRL